MAKKLIHFPATLRKIDGPRVSGEWVIMLDIPETATDVVGELTKLTKENFHVAIEVVKSEQEYLTKAKETGEERRKRYMSKIHAQLRDIASMKKITPEQAKDIIKDKLKQEGKLQESLNDMSVQELLGVIDRLDKVIFPAEEREETGQDE